MTKPQASLAVRMKQMADHLRATPGGGTSRDCSIAMGVTHRRAMDVATALVRAGGAVSMPEPGATSKDHRTLRYFAPEHAPAVPYRRAKQRTAAPSSGWKGEAYTTPATVITVAPPFVDRFAFDPPPGWKGQITLDREKELGL